LLPLCAGAQTAQTDAAPEGDIGRIVHEIKAANIEHTIRTLVAFGTRNTLSAQDDPKTWIGAARDWLYTKCSTGERLPAGGSVWKNRPLFSRRHRGIERAGAALLGPERLERTRHCRATLFGPVGDAGGRGALDFQSSTPPWPTNKPGSLNEGALSPAGSWRRFGGDAADVTVVVVGSHTGLRRSPDGDQILRRDARGARAVEIVDLERPADRVLLNGCARTMKLRRRLVAPEGFSLNPSC